MTYYFLGLGNVGERYHTSRHNLGRRAILQLKDHWDTNQGRTDWQSVGDYPLLAADYQPAGQTVRLLLPQTYMNQVGPKLTGFWPTIDLSQLVVVYDDLDLPLGRLKIDFGRSAGGHRGLDSIIQTVGRRDFIRFRLGIGSVLARSGREFVLAPFSPEEEKDLLPLWPQLFSAAETLINQGLARTQNIFN